MSDAMKLYDAGLLGGGHLPNADWWQDYLRAEIERANDFCGEQYEHLRADLASAREREQRMREALALIAVVDQGCGGNLSFKEMAESAMRDARAALGEPQ